MSHVDDADADCVFCAISSGRIAASTVHEDDDVIVFMDLHPATTGHVLVVPRRHQTGLEDLDRAAGARVWSVGQDLAHALRRAFPDCAGINLLLCDGAAALQSVFHVHLHVIPRYVGDGWTLTDRPPPERERSLLDADAEAIRSALRVLD